MLIYCNVLQYVPYYGIVNSTAILLSTVWCMPRPASLCIVCNTIFCMFCIGMLDYDPPLSGSSTPFSTVLNVLKKSKKLKLCSVNSDSSRTDGN